MADNTIEDAALEAWLTQLDESDMSLKLDAASRVTHVIQRLAPRHHVRVLRALLQSLSFRDTALIEHVVPAVSHVTRALIAQYEQSPVTVLAPGTRVLGPRLADRLEAATPAPFTEYNASLNSTAALVDEVLAKLVYEFKYTTSTAHLKIYMCHVPALVESAGPHVIKHLKPLLHHVLELFALADLALTRDLLATLHAIVRHCWIRMDYHAREIFQALLGAYIEHWGASEAEVTRSIGDLLGALKLCVSAAHWQELVEALQACEELRELNSRVTAV